MPPVMTGPPATSCPPCTRPPADSRSAGQQTDCSGSRPDLASTIAFNRSGRVPCLADIGSSDIPRAGGQDVGEMDDDLVAPARIADADNDGIGRSAEGPPRHRRSGGSWTQAARSCRRRGGGHDIHLDPVSASAGRFGFRGEFISHVRMGGLVPGAGTRAQWPDAFRAVRTPAVRPAGACGSRRCGR